ncbi:MAG: PD-(D/E)XK nuclease family protein [Fimbriimonadaceae bacterium]|nr:PD-(D/E)XK nuclease family protein [Fimbriimonadaceae bacterium]
MSRAQVRWLALTPTASNLGAALREWDAPHGRVIALDGQWFPPTPERENDERLGLAELLGLILADAKARVFPLADDALVQALVASACEEFSDDSRLAASAQYPGFHRRAVRVLTELESARLTPEEMNKFAAQLPQYLADKLYAVGQLQQTVDDKLHALGLETVEKRLSRVLSLKSIGEQPDIWLWAGSDYKPSLAALIRRLANVAPSVTVVLEALPGRNQLTAGAQRFASTFEVEPEFRGTVNSLASHLFQSTTPEKLDLRIQIASAADPLAETEWAVRMALEELAEDKPPSAIAIYARQLRDYRPLVASAANRLKLPVALSQQSALIETGIAAYVLELLRALEHGASPHLLRVAKSTYSGLTVSDREELAKLIEVPQWEEAPPTETNAGRWLKWSLEFGKEIYPRDAHPVDDLIRRLLARLGDEQIVSPTKNQEATRERDSAMLAAAAESLKRELQIRALDGETGLFAASMTGPEFVQFIERLWTTAVVHVQPSNPGVRITQDASSIGECQTLIILGMLEGIFPKRRSEDPILSDFERSQINALLPAEQGLDDSHAIARREREDFLRLCAIPTQRAIFLYPQTDEEKDNVPAFYLEEVRRVAGQALTQTDFPRNLFTPPGEECIAVADQILQQALLGERQPPALPALTEEKAIQMVLAEPDTAYTLSELRESIVCSFQFAFDRRLRIAKPTDDGDARLGHLPHEARLMLTPNEAAARDALSLALDLEIQKLSSRMTWEELQLALATGKRMIPEWIEREFRARELWPLTPDSLQTNVVFGDPMLPDVLPIPGQAVKLRGNVSGIGKFGDYRIALRYGANRGLIVDKLEKLEAPFRLELGLLLLSMTAGGHPFVGAQIDGASGGRVLYLCPRPVDVNIPSDLNAGLRVIPIDNRKEFFEEVKELLARSLDGMNRGSVMPCAGDHCKVCAFGELCRSSQLFGEQLALAEEEVALDES